MRVHGGRLLCAVLAGAMGHFALGCGKEDGGENNQDKGGSGRPGLDHGVSGDDSTTITVRAPEGSVTGHVQDTNGNPIAGAHVFVAGQMTTTDDGGNYFFASVQVTQVVKLAQANALAQAVSVTIVPPEGYLGATVTVVPTAQIHEGDNSPLGSSTEEDAQTVTTFTDGFLASAGTAVIPELIATVKGVVRNSVSGEPIAAVAVGLDLSTVGAAATAQEQAQNGVTTSYQSLPFSSTTAEDGSFSISGLPADSVMNFVFEDYTIVPPSPTTATTSGEMLATNVGTINVTRLASVDSVAPFVFRVANVVSQAAATGQFTDDVSTEIVITFSEAMASTMDSLGSTFNSVVVRDTTGAQYLTLSSATLAGNTLTLTLADPLVAGNTIHVNLLTADFMDQAVPANHIAAGTAVGFDSAVTTPSGNTYLRLALRAFSGTAQDAVTPSLAQLKVDDLGDDEIALVQALSDAFADVDDTTAGIQQLNSGDDDDGLINDAAGRLSALTAALNTSISGTGTTTVSTNVARIRFQPTAATDYMWRITDQNGTLRNVAPSFHQGATSVVVHGGAIPTGTGTFSADGSGLDFEFVITGVIPGDGVVVTPRDEFGYLGAAASITLVDNVPPTTILQSAYSSPVDGESGSVAAISFGDGAEQGGFDDVSVGTPYLNLTPRLLGEVDGTATGPNNDVDDVQTFVRLYENNAVNAGATAFSGANPDEQFIDEATNIYDSTAYAAYVANSAFFARTIGVAFSEDVALVGSAPTYTSVVGTITPTNFMVQNDVFREDDADQPGNAGGPFADLVMFDVSNVYEFAREEGGGVLDFAGSITDTATTPNAATAATHARVIVRDAIPPLVTSAVYGGAQLVITFDKGIDLSNGPSLSLGTAPLSIDLSDSANYTLSADRRTLTIVPAAWGEGAGVQGAGGVGGIFSLAAYDERTPNLTTVPVNGQYSHAILDFGTIENDNGADWNTYNTTVPANDYYFEKPRFAAMNTTKDFAVDTTNALTSGLGGTTITVVYEVTHAVDLSNADDNGDGTIDSSEVADLFVWSNGAGIAPSGNSFVTAAQADGAVNYTFTLSLNAASAAGDTLDIDWANTGSASGVWISEYDASQTVAAAATQVTF